MINKQEKNILDNTISELETKYGKGIIKTVSSIKDFENNVISSGSLSLDNALGINGFPRGRIIEIFGNESSGKTTIALQVAAQCQKNNGVVAYIDAENALDPAYCKKNNVDIDKLLLSQPEYGEQAFIIIDALIKTNNVDLIIVDSVAALVPKYELENNIDESCVGAHARLMSKGLRMIQYNIAKSNTCIIFINQVREKIGINYGNPEITTGGRALKFFSSIRLDVRRAEIIKNGSDITGIKSKITICKNKLAVPLKSCYIDIFFSKGYDYQNEIINCAIDYNIIKKNGSWFYYNDEKLCQGRSNINEYLQKNNDIYDKIKEEVKNKNNQ